MDKLPALPNALFDTLEYMECRGHPVSDYVLEEDYEITRDFLLAYRGSPDTFHSYRREVDRFLNWVYLVAQMDLNRLVHQDIENYIRFCQRPPAKWISTKMAPRFVEIDGKRIPNPEWRPYVVKVSKEAHQKGNEPVIKLYRISDKGIQATLRILSTFFTFLEMEDYIRHNPVKRIRQKSRLVRSRATQDPIRRLSDIQWDYVIETAELMADKDKKHERTLFILSALYGMYLRISELAETDLWSPMMQHFYQDADESWWFKTVGKGNKERDITVSADMLLALKRYRSAYELSPLPTPGDALPLIPKQRGAGGIRSTRQIRDVVQASFDMAISRLEKDGLNEDADKLKAATVHWLRHTGISDDVKKRPKEHVRDDAGHSSSATTDRYIDIEKRERHLSAKKKKLRPIA